MKHKNNIDYSEIDNVTLLYIWVTLSFLTLTDEDSKTISKEIKNRFKILPDQLSQKKEYNRRHTIDELIIELFGQIEYTSKFHYFLLHKGRKSLSILSGILVGIGVISFLLLQISIRSTDFVGEPLVYLIIAIFLCFLAFLTSKKAKSILNYIIKNVKPGDMLKILSGPDELISEKRKINQISGNETTFNKTTVFISKNKLLCENFISAMKQKKQNSIYDFLSLFITIDYLLNTNPGEAYSEYLVNIGIDALENVYAYRRESILVLYNLGILYLRKANYEQSKQYFYKYLEIVAEDIDAEAWLIVIDFLIKNKPAIMIKDQ